MALIKKLEVIAKISLLLAFIGFGDWARRVYESRKDNLYNPPAIIQSYHPSKSVFEDSKTYLSNDYRGLDFIADRGYITDRGDIMIKERVGSIVGDFADGSDVSGAIDVLGYKKLDSSPTETVIDGDAVELGSPSGVDVAEFLVDGKKYKILTLEKEFDESTKDEIIPYNK